MYSDFPRITNRRLFPLSLSLSVLHFLRREPIIIFPLQLSQLQPFSLSHCTNRIFYVIIFRRLLQTSIFSFSHPFISLYHYENFHVIRHRFSHSFSTEAYISQTRNLFTYTYVHVARSKVMQVLFERTLIPKCEIYRTLSPPALSLSLSLALSLCRFLSRSRFPDLSVEPQRSSFHRLRRAGDAQCRQCAATSLRVRISVGGRVKRGHRRRAAGRRLRRRRRQSREAATRVVVPRVVQEWCEIERVRTR